MIHPLLAAVGVLGLIHLATKGAASTRDGTRVIDVSQDRPKLLPSVPAQGTAKPKPKAKSSPKGDVSIGPITRIVNGQRITEPSSAQAQGNALSAQARATLPAMPSQGTAKVAAPPGTNLALARKLAGQTAAAIKKNGKAATAPVATFQRAAGLTPDGKYGPISASALRYFGAAAPAPLYKGQDLKYVPPGGA